MNDILCPRVSIGVRPKSHPTDSKTLLKVAVAFLPEEAVAFLLYVKPSPN
jgi:hypothetical protein